MTRLVVVLVAAAVLVGACGDTTEPREFIEPVPFDPATDLVGSTTTTNLPPDTTPAIFASDRAASMLIDLVQALDLEDVPREAWDDFALAGCDEGVWDRGVNFALAEDFSTLPFSSLDALADEQILVAELMWLNAVARCSDDFPSGAIERGPPALYEFPRCRHPLELWALPWSPEVTEADTGEDHSLGLTYSIWAEGDGSVAVIQGADPSFDDAFETGTAIGDINGDPAVSFGDAERVMVMWRTTEWHCGAFRIEFHPVPETDDLAGFIEGLLTPPDYFFGNPAEERMSATIELIEGYEALGGEPSHGGRDAVYAFGDSAGWFDVRAVPIGVEDRTAPKITDAIEAGGVTYELFYDDQGSLIITRGVTWRTDEYRITVRSEPDDERLIDFALEFHRAWMAAGPGATEG